MAKSIKHPYQPSANMGCDTEFYLSKKKKFPYPIPKPLFHETCCNFDTIFLYSHQIA